MSYNEVAEYVSVDDGRKVVVKRDLAGDEPSPREVTDANVGTFLAWHRAYRSPDENRWGSAVDWIADMLDERLADKEMLDAVSAGRVGGLVGEGGVRDDDEFCHGPVTVVQSWVRRSWAPDRPFWDDAVVLDATEREMIEAGCDLFAADGEFNYSSLEYDRDFEIYNARYVSDYVGFEVVACDEVAEAA